MRVMQAQTTFFTNIATPSVVATKQVDRGIYQHFVALLEAVQQQGRGDALSEVRDYAESIDAAHSKLDRLLTTEVYRQGLTASKKQIDAIWLRSIVFWSYWQRVTLKALNGYLKPTYWPN